MQSVGSALHPNVKFLDPVIFRIPDLSAHQQRLAKAGAIAGLSERVEACRALYNEDVTRAWNQFAADADTHLSFVNDEERGRRLAIDKHHEGNTDRCKADYNSAEKTAEAEADRLKRDVASRWSSAEATAKGLWDKIGRGLDLEEPARALPALRDAAHPDPEFSPDSLGSLEREADARSALRQAGQDPALTSYPNWAAGGGFVLGFIVSQNFVLSLIFAALAWGGTKFWRTEDRKRAKRLYEHLLQDLVQDYFAQIGTANGEHSIVQQRLMERKAVMNDLISRSADEAQQATTAIVAASAKARESGAITYKAGKLAFSRLVDAIASTIRSASEEAPDLLAPWTSVSSPLPDRTELSWSERSAARLGESFPQLLKAAGYDSGQPLHLKEGGAQLWRIGRGKSLLLVGGASTANSPHSPAMSTIMRLLHQMPRGKVRFTLFDPIALGASFAPLLELGDDSAHLIGGRVWSSPEHLRLRLREVIEHIEQVTQKYLQNRYASIEEYTAATTDVPEPYRFLVLEHFPEGFDEERFKDLARILRNGPRCGVYVIMRTSALTALPRGIDLEPLRPYFAEAVENAPNASWLVKDGPDATPSLVRLDPPPGKEMSAEIVTGFGKGAAESVQVGYGRLLQRARTTEVWTRSSAAGIAVPLGPAGNRVQMLELGSKLAHHALLVGRPGSGKSNLLHIFITTAARLYSPSELQLYLIDFKQGVEFKPYADARLPHAHVVALESEREFGLSVLQGLEAEMGRRGALFAKAGVQNIAEYRGRMSDTERQDPSTILPRIVLVIDEFQQIFVKDDKIKRDAVISIGRLVSQARYSGIHLLFATQSLATASLDRAIRDQMTVRIALQCSEADSKLILAEDNTAARMLSRPGEAIYNNDAGLKDGNNLFQVAMLKEEDRDRELRALCERARGEFPGHQPIIFAGHEPGDMSTSAEIVGPRAPVVRTPSELKLWLGASTSLRPLVSPVLKRHGGRNLLVLSRDEEEGVGVVMAALMSIAVQCVPGDARFEILDLTSADAPWADHPEEFRDSIPHSVNVLGRHQARELFTELAKEVNNRTKAQEEGQTKAAGVRGAVGTVPNAAAEVMSPLLLIVLGLHRVRDLRSEGGARSYGFSLTDEPQADAHTSLRTILRDGPEVGVHSIIWCDTYGNLERSVDRGGLDDLGIRVSGPLGDQESRRLFDEDTAAGIDKPHRMVIGDDDRVGVVDVFRPFAAPTFELIRAVGQAMAGTDPTTIKEAAHG